MNLCWILFQFFAQVIGPNSVTAMTGRIHQTMPRRAGFHYRIHPRRGDKDSLMERSRDRKLVHHFLDTYNRARGKSFSVSSWPDDTNRNAPAVDAIATDGPLTMAIEHTLIQPFVDERHESDIFNQVVDSLEDDPKLCQPGWDSAMSMPAAIQSVYIIRNLEISLGFCDGGEPESLQNAVMAANMCSCTKFIEPTKKRT
jgi:hypothetical protein